MKKRILAIGLGTVMTLAMLTGCGKDDSNPVETPSATPTQVVTNETPTETPTEAPTTTPEPVVKTDFDECYEIAVAFGEACASGNFETLESINTYLKETYKVEIFEAKVNSVTFDERFLAYYNRQDHSETKVTICNSLYYMDDEYYNCNEEYIPKLCQELMEQLNISTYTKEKAVDFNENNILAFGDRKCDLRIKFLKISEFDGWILLVGSGSWRTN